MGSRGSQTCRSTLRKRSKQTHQHDSHEPESPGHRVCFRDTIQRSETDRPVQRDAAQSSTDEGDVGTEEAMVSGDEGEAEEEYDG